MATSARQTSTRKPVARKSVPRQSAAAKHPAAVKKPATNVVSKQPSAKTVTKAEKATASEGKLSESLAAATKPGKVKKTKMVRDGFTMPKAEYASIELLKRRAALLGREPKKSELLRAGLMLLNQIDDAAFTLALAAVPPIKTGRPKT